MIFITWSESFDAHRLLRPEPHIINEILRFSEYQQLPATSGQPTQNILVQLQADMSKIVNDLEEDTCRQGVDVVQNVLSNACLQF